MIACPTGPFKRNRRPERSPAIRLPAAGRGVILSASKMNPLFLLLVGLFLVLYLPLKSFIEAGYRMASPLPELFTVALIVLALALIWGGWR